MWIIPTLLLGGIAGMFIGAYLQSKLRKPIEQRRHVNVYLLPERRSK